MEPANILPYKAKGLAAVIKINDLERDDPELSGWTQPNYKSPQRERTFPNCDQRTRERWQHKKERLNLLLLSLKMEGRGHKQRMWSASRSCKKQGNGFSLRESRKNWSLGSTLILAQWDLYQSFYPKNYKINLYFFSYQGGLIWSYVTAAIQNLHSLHHLKLGLAP